MDLRHLTDKVLLLDTKKLVSEEREVTVKVLHHIKEIDRRKLYSDLNFSSLHEYCIKELGYSEGGAHRRITSARLIKDIPSIEKRIEQGKLSLSNITSANKFFKDHDIRDVNIKKDVLFQIENLSKRECDQKLFELSGANRPKTTTLTILDSTYVKLQEVKDLSGKIFNVDELISFMAEAANEKILKEKFKQTVSKGSPPPAEVNRVIPAEIKRKVFKRDQKCVNCGSIHNLNYDHKKPYALGGGNTIENIRLLCFSCNQRARIKAKL